MNTLYGKLRFKPARMRFYVFLLAALCGILLFYACDFPGIPPGGESYLTINLPGNPGTQADSSRAVISNATISALEYKITFTGPDSAVMTEIIPPGSGSFSVTLTPGAWSIAAEAYDPPGVSGGALVGTGSKSVTLAPGDSVTVPIAMSVISAYEAGLTTYYIHNEADLRRIGVTLPVGPTKTFILENNITLTQPWTAIGSNTAPFKADFDGRGHTITITSFDDPVIDSPMVLQGFFASVADAEIKDLTIRYNLSGQVDMTTGNPLLTSPAAGGIAGNAYNTVFKNIQVVGVNNFSFRGDGTYCMWVGGIAGCGTNTTIERCHVSGAIAGNNSASTLDIGGISGTISSSTINRSFFTGTINGTAASYVGGGIAGFIVNGSDISECYAEGRIEGTGTNSVVGGIAGYIDSSINVQKSYASGVINGTGTSLSSSSGGIVGTSYGGTIKNCYARAYVEAQTSTGTSTAGGIVGAHSGTLLACYALGTVKTTSGISPIGRYAGGIAGWLETGTNTVRYCVALNETITALSTPYLPPPPSPFLHGIAGSDFGSTVYTSNYAASNMTFTPSIVMTNSDLNGDITTYSRSAFAGSATNYPSAGWTFDSTNWKFISGYNYPVPFWQTTPPADPASFE
jgi:hypothetical protein